MSKNFWAITLLPGECAGSPFMDKDHDRIKRAIGKLLIVISSANFLQRSKVL